VTVPASILGRKARMMTRLIAAAGVLVSAGVHLYLWVDGVRDQHVVGPAFMVNAVAGLVIATLLMTWRHWVPLFLAAGFGLATLGAFLISVTVGLFGVHEHWIGVWVWTALVAEVVAVVAAATAGVREGYVSPGATGPWAVRSAPLD